jgi:hypothetical protein
MCGDIWSLAQTDSSMQLPSVSKDAEQLRRRFSVGNSSSGCEHADHFSTKPAGNYYTYMITYIKKIVSYFLVLLLVHWYIGSEVSNVRNFTFFPFF